MTKREKIYNKYGGRCAYSGTILECDWQIDHIRPKAHFEFFNYENEDVDDIKNLYPTQKIINHYKRSFDPEDFKKHRLNNLHLKLKKLPKNPKCGKSIKRKEYILKVALYFGITENRPFCGKFYFEMEK